MSDKETKQGSWAPSDLHTPEQYDNKEWAAQRQAALDTAQITIANTLVEMLAEQKRINDHFIATSGMVSKPKTTSPASAPAPDRTTPQPTKITQPSKFDEDAIVKYYREKLSTVLDEKDLSETVIRVQENDVYVKFPWLGKEKFGPVGGLMRGLNSEYVSDGKNTHYLAPII